MSKKPMKGNHDKENINISDEIYTWLESLPLPVFKLKKKTPRDFSDAVLYSDLLKFFYPRLVETHNYIQVNSVHMKRENWKTLNRKVLSKLDMKVTQEVIEKLANSDKTAIEKILNDLRKKTTKVQDVKQTEESQIETIPGKTFGKIWSFLFCIWTIFPSSFWFFIGSTIKILFFWKLIGTSSEVEKEEEKVVANNPFPNNNNNGNNNNNNNEPVVKMTLCKAKSSVDLSQSGSNKQRSQIYSELQHSLKEKERTICDLNNRITRFKSMMKSKDFRIEDLKKKTQKIKSDK